jgi:acetyl esterase/lipase
MAMNADTVPEEYRDRFISMEQNAQGPIITKEGIEFIMCEYQLFPQRYTVADAMSAVYGADMTSPLALPILFPDHSKLPKTYFQICGLDPVRDGGLIFEQVLKDCGIETKTDVYPGLPHAFWGPFIHAEFTKRYHKDSAEGLAWLLKS